MHGKKAPGFKLKDQNGDTRSLTEFAGKWLVIYFYPKDNTPGCTTQACSLRDERELIANQTDAEIIGISKDSVDSHKKFADKYSLNFTLLSDPEGKVIEAYGAWGKKMFGKEGVLRQTFIVNPEGFVAKEYKRAKPIGHGKQILDDLKKLQKTPR